MWVVGSGLDEQSNFSVVLGFDSMPQAMYGIPSGMAGTTPAIMECSRTPPSLTGQGAWLFVP